MTDAQRKRLDVKIIFWIYTILFLLLFSWNWYALLFISEVLSKVLKFPFDMIMKWRYSFQEWYIKFRKIERDGIIGSTSKYYGGK